MKKKYYWIVGIVIVVLIAVFISFFLTESMTDQKYCKSDSDCVGICGGCCDNCCSFDNAVNKDAADKIRLSARIECISQDCVMPACPLPTTVSVPVCVNNQCAIKKVPYNWSR